MKLLIWDFDGTLGYRNGGAWTASVFEVVQRVAPDRGVTFEQLRPYMDVGFRWHAPDRAHPAVDPDDPGAADAWWAELEAVFTTAYRGVGFTKAEAERMAKLVRPTYLTSSRWRCFEDAEPALAALAVKGWTHAILSNHVPELPALVAGLGLRPYFARILNSAQMGYEKPHPRAFEHVLAALPDATVRWMIGDSYRADVQGAEAAGIPAILVRRPHPDARFYAETLTEIADIIETATTGTGA